MGDPINFSSPVKLKLMKTMSLNTRVRPQIMARLEDWVRSQIIINRLRGLGSSTKC